MRSSRARARRLNDWSRATTPAPAATRTSTTAETAPIDPATQSSPAVTNPAAAPSEPQTTCSARKASTSGSRPARSNRRRAEAAPPSTRSTAAAASTITGLSSRSTTGIGVRSDKRADDPIGPARWRRRLGRVVSRRYGAKRSSRVGRRDQGTRDATSHSPRPPPSPRSAPGTESTAKTAGPLNAAPSAPRAGARSGSSRGRPRVSKPHQSPGREPPRGGHTPAPPGGELPTAPTRSTALPPPGELR